jgi:hypothetical protein
MAARHREAKEQLGIACEEGISCGLAPQSLRFEPSFPVGIGVVCWQCLESHHLFQGSQDQTKLWNALASG